MLSIRMHPSFVPGPRIFYCYFPAGQKVLITNLHNITKKITLCSDDLMMVLTLKVRKCTLPIFLVTLQLKMQPLDCSIVLRKDLAR